MRSILRQATALGFKTGHRTGAMGNSARRTMSTASATSMPSSTAGSVGQLRGWRRGRRTTVTRGDWPEVVQRGTMGVLAVDRDYDACPGASPSDIRSESIFGTLHALQEVSGSSLGHVHVIDADECQQDCGLVDSYGHSDASSTGQGDGAGDAAGAEVDACCSYGAGAVDDEAAAVGVCLVSVDSSCAGAGRLFGYCGGLPCGPYLGATVDDESGRGQKGEEEQDGEDRDRSLLSGSRASVETLARAGTRATSRRCGSSSGTAMVRAEAVQALTGAGDIAPAVEALSDRNPMVRAVAQVALRRAGSDPAAYYRRLVTRVPPKPGTIAGLGETGTPDDASLIRPWLDHPLPRCRAETIRALRRLGAADKDTISRMLTDPSGRVTRQVATTLRPWADRLDVRWLRQLLAETNPRHVRMAAYRLLRDRDAWTRLLVDLELLRDPSPSMRNRARSDVTAWVTREAPTHSTRSPRT
jgi:hypothetical protein